MPTAKKAELKDVRLKILVWGDPGAGKSRFALSAPKPLVIDTEKSTILYANEFDFLIAETDPDNLKISSYVSLTTQILEEFKSGEYPETETLVIDNLTDVLDGLEGNLQKNYEKSVLKDKKLADLNKLELSKWYAYRKKHTRRFLDMLIANKTHVIFTGRSRLEWGMKGGFMQPTGNTLFDGLEIVESLVDIVMHLKKEAGGNVRAIIKKSRIANLLDELDIKTFSEIQKAIETPYNANEIEES